MRSISYRQVSSCVALICGALLFEGCNTQSSENLLPVSGKVTVEGKPLKPNPTGNVTFHPDASKGNETKHLPLGVIDAEGNYEIFVPGGKKGAPPGWYKAVVVALDDPQPGKPLKYLAAKVYSEVENTPLTIEVIAKPEPERYDLKLKR